MAIKLSLVIPTYNEKENIVELCRKLTGVLDKLRFDFEIIIVDDNSPDGTWRIAEDLTKQDKRIKVIRRMYERGPASAVVSGWAVSQGEILGVIDGDLQHPPEILEGMISQIINHQEIDIVVASRYVAGGGILNRSFWQVFRSRLAFFLGRIFVPKIFKLVKDPLSGYFILRRRVIETIPLIPIGCKILLEVLAKCSYEKIYEMPYVFQARKRGRSKICFRQYFLFLLHLIKLKGN